MSPDYLLLAWFAGLLPILYWAYRQFWDTMTITEAERQRHSVRLWRASIALLLWLGLLYVIVFGRQLMA